MVLPGTFNPVLNGAERRKAAASGAVWPVNADGSALDPYGDASGGERDSSAHVGYLAPGTPVGDPVLGAGPRGVQGGGRDYTTPAKKSSRLLSSAQQRPDNDSRGKRGMAMQKSTANRTFVEMNSSGTPVRGIKGNLSFAVRDFGSERNQLLYNNAQEAPAGRSAGRSFAVPQPARKSATAATTKQSRKNSADEEEPLVKMINHHIRKSSLEGMRLSLADATQLHWSNEGEGSNKGSRLSSTTDNYHIQVKSALEMPMDESQITLPHPRSFSGRTRARRFRMRLLNPRSRTLKYWDPLMGVFLIFISLVTPFEVAFLTPKYDGLFAINRAIDIMFLIDIILHFFLPYQTAGGHWIVDPKNIVRHYVSTWFCVDVISIVPFDFFSLQGSASADLRLIRLVRLFRLTKLLRILRAGRMLQRWEATVALNYARIALAKFATIAVLVCHWLACAWYLVIEFDTSGEKCGPECVVEKIGSDNTLSWINTYPYLEENAGPFSIYVVALYWSIATLSTLGYGDVVPTTDSERAFTVVAMITGASAYGYMIGNACSLILGLDEKNHLFYQTMDTLNTYMGEKNLPTVLRIKLRDFFRFRRHNVTAADTDSLLRQMSPMLRSEVTLHVHSRWITRVAAFQKCDPAFVHAVTMNLTTEAFSEGEPIVGPGQPATKMYIVERGIIHVGDSSTICTHGDAFGVDMIFRRGTFRRMYTCFTLTNAVVMVLHKQTLFRLLDEFPQQGRALRKYVIHTVFRTNILQYKDAVQRLQKFEREGWVVDLE